jgi:hypothetical protein
MPKGLRLFSQDLQEVGYDTDFLDCIRDGGKRISDPRAHHRSVSWGHLANIAMRRERPLKWPSEKEEFPNDEAANSIQTRPQREGYHIDVAVS